MQWLDRINGYLTIKRKIILLAVFTTLIPLILISTFTFVYLTRDAENKISSTTSNLLSIVDWNIDMFVVDVESISKLILASREIQEFLSYDNNDSTEIQGLQSEAKDFLTNVWNNKPYIHVVFVGNDHRELLIDRGQAITNENMYSSITETQWFEKVTQYDGKGIWFKNGQGDFMNESDPLNFGKLLKDVHTHSLQTIGVLNLQVDRRVFDDMFKHMHGMDSGSIAILEDKNIIYFKGPSKVKEAFERQGAASILSGDERRKVEEINGEKYIININVNEKTNWKIVSIIPYTDIIKEISHVRIFTGILIILSVLLASIGAYLISNKIIKQLNLLNKVMRDSENLPDMLFDDRDDIGKIGNQLIRLFKQNNELTISLYESRLKAQEAELLSLQSHINPHFLYNTLNSVYLMAEQAKAKKIAKMAINLSKIFKITLNNGNHITSVKHEMEQVKSYMEIQNIRFDQKFELIMDIDPEMQNEKMLKLLIQPIVENSIQHGLELKAEKGYIQIKGRKQEDQLIFEIIDNGIGFDSSQQLIPNHGYALKNINERIRLQYGPAFGMSIESQINKGTRVVIKIGILREEVA